MDNQSIIDQSSVFEKILMLCNNAMCFLFIIQIISQSFPTLFYLRLYTRLQRILTIIVSVLCFILVELFMPNIMLKLSFGTLVISVDVIAFKYFSLEEGG
jgi:hypothetical protein